MKLSIPARNLLVRLALLNRTQLNPDSHQNPIETRNARVLTLRKKLVQALGQISTPDGLLRNETRCRLTESSRTTNGPLEPLRRPCPTCKGRGTDARGHHCPTCIGQGEIQFYDAKRAQQAVPIKR